MGLEDRDWWRDAHRERERKRASLEQVLAKVSSPSMRRLPGMPWALRLGHVGILAFWFAVMGVVWVAMNHYLKPKPVVVTAQGDLKIARARDGHFYAPGTVNGKSTLFLVDTGASAVTVSEEFAKSAGLPDGQPTIFNTANGPLQGRTVRDVPVSVGPISVSAVTVGVGLVGRQPGDALLGQSFLSKFEVTLSKEELTLHRP
jgi:aspartyl protease family protein